MANFVRNGGIFAMADAAARDCVRPVADVPAARFVCPH